MMVRLVVFLGPDGAGKSSIIAEVKKALAERGVNISQFYFAPGFFRRYRPRETDKVTITTNPHDFGQYHPVVAVAKLILLLTEFVAGIRKYRSSNELLIFDRYIFDLYVDPLRYRLARLPKFILSLVRFAPRPDLVVVVRAPYDVIQARKSEVSSSETKRQLEDYGRLEWGREVMLLDNTGPINKVIEPLVEKICNGSC